MIFDLATYIKDISSLVNQALEEALPPKDAFPSRLHESMRYSLMAGGKRIRPILCLAAAETCGGRQSDVLPLACALEMIHCFSLIHDDLPAMDDDGLRRGQPTNHKIYGEAVAILAGDALAVDAFSILGKLGSGASDAERILEIMRDIAEACGSPGMIAGQIADLESEGKKLSLSELKRLHQLKTGRLITVAVTSGAKMVTDDKQKIESLARYGNAVGLAFQIADDILDIVGGKELGKDIGSDEENNKATFPLLLGLEASRREAKKAVEDACDALKLFGDEADALRALAAYIIERKR